MPQSFGPGNLFNARNFRNEGRIERRIFRLLILFFMMLTGFIFNRRDQLNGQGFGANL
jgi:hypothetical protein